MMVWKEEIQLKHYPYHNVYKKDFATFHLYMKGLHKSDEAPPDMAPASFTYGKFPSTSTTTSTGTYSSANIHVLYIKHSVALAGLNKFETLYTNPGFAEFANILYTVFNSNKWGLAGLDSTSPNNQCQDLKCAYFKIYVLCLELLYCHLFLLISMMWQEISLPFNSLLFTICVKILPLAKKHIKKEKPIPEWKKLRTWMRHSIRCHLVFCC